jgi:pyoverdine/dityrosine biosynthesis protein Dit1
MAPNKGTSTYHSIQGLYWRTSSGDLLAVEGMNSRTLPEVWPLLKEEILSTSGSWSQKKFPSGQQINTLQITADIPALKNIRANFPPERREDELVTKVAEIQHADGNVLGMLTSRPQSLATDTFAEWAENFFLLETEFRPFASLSDNAEPEHLATVEKVTVIFEEKLKNLSKDDQWEVCGRVGFKNRVYGYVQRNEPILLALPAFPCKSPNPTKVGGIKPDLAEHIALEVLHDFVLEVNKVYPPGASMWVINDGHVFSDCIGADDIKVDTFDAEMLEVYKAKYPNQTGLPTIQFKGLMNIFKLEADSFSTFDESLVSEYSYPHPVTTKTHHHAELVRKLMLLSSEPDRAYIRSCIEQQEPDALQLYRGQTRFMLEDLANVPAVSKLSNKQKKKVAALVAQEMISRNQAYSNLVELLLPNYVRLSIHAHNNKGPKFAVRLLPKSIVRPIENLENRYEPVAAYEFQIPTPWHNAIIEVEGDELLYLARADVARQALKKGKHFEGSWSEGDRGAYFKLTRKDAPSLPPLVTVLRRSTTKLISPVAQKLKKKPTYNMTSSPIAEKRQRRPTFVFQAPMNAPVEEVKPTLQKTSTVVWVSDINEKPVLQKRQTFGVGNAASKFKRTLTMKF